MNDYSHNWFLNYMDFTPGYTCANCEYANEYIAYWWYPYLDPTCSKGRSINPNKPACSDFRLMNREKNKKDK